MKNKLKKLDIPSDKGAGLFEWLCFALIGIFCYIFFCHQDILITAGHSIEYLKGHIGDFYSACYKTDGTYGANYLPSTFILFAIWNIPSVLFGFAPDFFGDWTTAFTMWNKLLPTLAYLLSGVAMYKLTTKRLGFENKKAMLTVFLMFTAPMAFFCQFFFCQYDIFTVLFMLIGLCFYLKKKPATKDYILFALFFGIATTFKYFSILIFAVLLLLRVKDIIKDIALLIISALPAGAEALFYLLTDRKVFIKSVFGFSALGYADGFSINLGEVSVNLMYVAVLVIIAFSYFTVPDTFDKTVGWAMFYSCGICFALFGMMFWHSQWAIFVVPFWVISTVINKNYKVLWCVEALQGVVFLVYVVNKFQGTVADQCLFRYGILNNLLNYKQPATYRMCDFFIYQNEDMLFTILSAIFLICFVFKHPKFNFESIAQSLSEGRFIINIRFLAFALAFITGAFACLPSFLERPENLWRRFGGEDTQIVTINNKTFADEYTELEEMTVEYVYIVCDKRDSSYKSTIFVDVIDTATGETVAHGKGTEKNIADGDTEDFTKLKLEKPFKSHTDTLYKFRFYTDTENEVAVYFEKNKNEASYLYRIYQKDYSSSYAEYDGKSLNGAEPVMRLTGKI